MKRFEQLEILVEYLGVEEALDQIVKAMSDFEFEDIFNFLCQVNEIEECE